MYLARCPDVISVKEGFFDVETIWPQLEQALQQAVNNLVAMRETEGGNIYGDFIKRAALIEEKLLQIEARSPQVVEEYQERLSERFYDLLEKYNQTVEPERLLQEDANFADRTSNTEEIVRLKSHIKHMKETLEQTEGIGRKLDFIAQEMNREANTILSKANDLEVSNYAIDLKTEIEKVREQIQNIE